MTDLPQKKTKSIESNDTKPNIEQITLKSVKTPSLISDRKIVKTESELEPGKTEPINESGNERGIKLDNKTGKVSRVTKVTSTRTVRNDRDTSEKEKESSTTTTASISAEQKKDSSTNDSLKPDSQDGKGIMGKLKNMFKF